MRVYYFFVILLIYSYGTAANAASPCGLNKEEVSSLKRVKVRSVVDGDTVRLMDKQLVRFIAVNSPEIDHEYGLSQPFADQAKNLLESIVRANHNTLLLKIGNEKQDRHGRLLAHVFTPDGDNVQARLLEQGLAFWIVVPPNLELMDCYRLQESLARNKKSGLWANEFSAARNGSALTKNDRGFQIIRGKVTRIGKGKVFTWINIGTKVALRIHKNDMKYFNDVDIEQLKHRTITARGWMFPYKKQMVMSLRHSASMEIE